jgi:hypothetical protein
VNGGERYNLMGKDEKRIVDLNAAKLVKLV